MTVYPERLGDRLSPEADALLQLAVGEARSLGAESIRPEHLLLALLRDPESPAAEALLPLRLTTERVLEVLSPDGTSETTAPPSTQAGTTPIWSRSALLVIERADDEATYRDAEKIRPAHLLVAIDPWEESIARVLSGLRPRVRPHDFVKAARGIPNLDEA